jgi:leucyl aminopeptidase (aminopeptidase T)
MRGNRTDLTVQFHSLKNPDRETNFENCVADVNIPVGEVFTSPVLKGTNGTLHVSQVYLEGLNFRDLEIHFKDGMIESASCSNFEKQEDNDAYIRDNILFHHDTLPMGEFAIGTNTTAYAAARKFEIASRLPILIAEKTGPHFAIGDTCYSMSEELKVYNPDGKEIVAKDNEVSILRKTEIEKAYLNCHTDITIPYNELGEITVYTYDNKKIEIIKEGRFVLEGTEELNKAFDNLLK